MRGGSFVLPEILNTLKTTFVDCYILRSAFMLRVLPLDTRALVFTKTWFCIVTDANSV